jgi:hypothetical protein
LASSKAVSSRVTVLCDEEDGVLKSLHALLGKTVIIGIPENSERESNGDYIQNAMIAYFMEFGSPLHNVPARPFLIPGATKALPKMIPQMQIAATAATDCDIPAALKALNRAGAMGAQSVRTEMSSGAFVPLQPATVASRARARGEKRSRDEIKYLALVAGGTPPGEAQAMAGIQPLINSGQLRDAITYSVRVVTK